MEHRSPEWEEPAPGIKILRLYQTRLTRDWPKIVVLELTAERFREFEHDMLAFDEKYRLVHDSPISWISPCAKPPQVKGVANAPDSASWTVVILKGGATKATCAAYPQESP